MRINLTVNGDPRTFDCDYHESLRRVLRREGFFSVRFGSETGETGADAVLVDGRLVSSEIMLAAQADGHAVDTVEGLSPGRGLHPIQEAFVTVGAIQSGYATPAMVLAAKALLDENPDPTDAEIRDALTGVLDRETGYLRPVEAIRRAAAVLRGEGVEPFESVLVRPLVDFDGKADFDSDAPPLDLPPVAPRVVPSPEVPDTRVVGKPEVKVDALKLVKGNPAFVDDVEMRGMLYAKMVWSPHAHARIVRIDDTRARALPGVRAVLHHENVPRVRYASGGQSYPNPLPYDQVSFDNKVRHVGDRVAVVAADTLEIAEAAVQLIDVEYEVLPAIFDENQAMVEGAPVIHDEPDMEGAFDAARNIVHHIRADVGDVEAGFAEADLVFEKTLRVHQVQPAPIEPHIAIAWLDSDERLVVRTSTQVPFHVRRMLAPLLDLPVRRIRVIKPRIGGGFGVKQEMLIEDIVGHLALVTGKPVRLELTRHEEFVSSRTRHPQTITMKTGVNRDGKLVAQQMRTLANTGPYGTHGLTVQMVSGLRGLSSYNCPNKRFDCDVVYTNVPVPGAYRGYGAPQALFALEAHMDDIAAGIGMDVLAFKRMNWTTVGDPLDVAAELGEGAAEMKFIPVVTSSGLEECVAQGQRAVGWHRRTDPDWRQPADRPHIRRGIGFAMCMHGSAISGLDMGGASIKINDDGSFNLLFGATDLGTGADTILAQIAAEVLGTPVEDIVVYAADTDMTPFDVGAYASSTTYVSGMAVKKAAEEVSRQIADRAALDARPQHARRHIAARSPCLGSRRHFGEPRRGGASFASPGSATPDHGYRLVRGPGLSAALRRPVCRGRGRRRHRPGHRELAGHGRRLWSPDQPCHFGRSGRGRDDPSPGLWPLRGDGLRRIRADGQPEVWAVQDLSSGRSPPHRGLPRSNDGEEWAVRGQGHRRDSQGRGSAGYSQRDRQCHRGPDRQPPVDSGAGVGGTQRMKP